MKLNIIKWFVPKESDMCFIVYEFLDEKQDWHLEPKYRGSIVHRSKLAIQQYLPTKISMNIDALCGTAKYIDIPWRYRLAFRRKVNKIYWELLHQYKIDEAKKLLEEIRKIGDEYR